MANDDDILMSPVPDPDAEATPSERAHARTFADLVDKAIAGRAPAAMSADDRALLEVATVIRAASGNVELAADKQRSIVEGALRQAIGGASASLPGVTSIETVRGRRLPWVIAGAASLIAIAAILLLWFRTAAPGVTATTAAAQTPTSWTSRPADALIGPIARERAGEAGSRIDTIFADRMDGYRERRLSPRGEKR